MSLAPAAFVPFVGHATPSAAHAIMARPTPTVLLGNYSDAIHGSPRLRLALAACFHGDRVGGRDGVHSLRADAQCRAALSKRARPSARASHGNVAQVCQGRNSPVSVNGPLQLLCRGGSEASWRRAVPRVDGDQDPAGVRRLLPGGSARGPLRRVRPLASEAKTLADGADPLSIRYRGDLQRAPRPGRRGLSRKSECVAAPRIPGLPPAVIRRIPRTTARFSEINRALFCVLIIGLSQLLAANRTRP